MTASGLGRLLAHADRSITTDESTHETTGCETDDIAAGIASIEASRCDRIPNLLLCSSMPQTRRAEKLLT